MRRLLREQLESQEVTPRSEILARIQALELDVDSLLDAVRDGTTDPEPLAQRTLDDLNSLYLYLSPEEPTLTPAAPTPTPTSS